MPQSYITCEHLSKELAEGQGVGTLKKRRWAFMGAGEDEVSKVMWST